MLTDRYGVEARSVEQVPDAERYGRTRSLFTLWFGANMQVTTITAGALAVVVGLDLPWAILSIVVGNLVGAVFMALHSAQGPVLGIPQMIQSRAQFGYYGAIVPIVLVLLMYLGYFASSSVQGGQALASWTGLPVAPAIAVLSAGVALLAVYGYRVIHTVQKWVSLVGALAFAVLTVGLLAGRPIGELWRSAAPPSAGTFLLAVSVCATWQLTYAPYVADYSRYLPRNVSRRAAFWYSYAGTSLASIWMMAFGAVAAATSADAFAGGSIDFVIRQSPVAHPLFYAVVIVGIAAVNALNLYGIFMSLTTISGVRRPIGTRARALAIICAAAVGALLAIVGKDDFLTNFLDFILLLAYFLIPWSAINLADFYLVRRERYDIGAIFDPDGMYGRVNGRVLAAYGVAVLVEVPFVSTAFYTGPMVARLGDADISWILGLAVAAVLYVLVMRRAGRGEQAPAVPRPEESQA